MNIFRKIMKSPVLAFVLSLCLVLGASGFPVQAAEPYTYTVTFYAGDKGTFSGTGVQVSSQSGKVQVNPGSSRITVTGLEYGDRVGLAAASGGVVSLNDGGKYYVKGIRKSGYDNNTVAAASFEVTGDADYVVAYGIRGNMAAYTVNFQDASGNTLAESQTYYGNVGDKPVVAFLYVDGYVPEAYNLTKTLTSDESQNVFTFVYTPVRTAAANPSTPSGNQGGTTAAGGGTGNQTTGTADGQNAENAGNAEGQNGEDAGGQNAENGEGGQEMQEVPEEDVPRDLVDLDDEEKPLANKDLTSSIIKDPIGAVRRNGPIAAICAVLLVGCGIYFFIIIWRKKHKKA